MTAVIRRAGGDDVSVLAALGTTTCYEAYFELDPSRDLAEYCLRVYSPETVAAELGDDGTTFFLAERDGRAVGFAKLRENSVACVTEALSLELQRIYVLERLKNTGIGRLLLAAAIDEARARGRRVLWLGAWDKNLAAQRFYERLGLRRVGTTGFTDGKNDFVNYVYAIDI